MTPLSIAGRRAGWAVAALILVGGALVASRATADLAPLVPSELRGQSSAERSGTHDANRIRTVFWNYGMVGDFPPDPLNVDLSVFHSVEVPKGTGMNYTDGITPFVLARIVLAPGDTIYPMETGYRERQGISRRFKRMMRFEPRPGYFQPNPNINGGRSPAVSNDPRTWPTSWPDKDQSWSGQWNGYFGKRTDKADEESFTVMDDDFYDSFDFRPDSRDSTRLGLGLKVEVRGFQWTNPQAGNVVFWHYDITNEGTTDYDDNIIFGLYMDSGVGGSSSGCDGRPESDDDNAFFDRSFGLNLVYTWDNRSHGVDLQSDCDRTGYLGYAYMETPGNPYDHVDNDQDGIIDEVRDGGPGDEPIVGPAAIRAYVESHYDLAKFEATFGPLDRRPAYKAGIWWPGDEDLDWVAGLHDLGDDGAPDTHDAGEGDGKPTEGEPYFDRTDKDESDQIGLTGFKMNRIRAAPDNPDQDIDDIVFYTESHHWPERLWKHFNAESPQDRFDDALASNYNIGFLFASGPFKLPAGKRERFSLALAYGFDLTELRETVRVVQLIYNANYQFAVSPPKPTLTAETGDGYVRLSWDDVAEHGIDPVTNENDFEGYRIYRSTDPEFRDPQVVPTGSSTIWVPNGKPIAQFDLVDGRTGFSRKVVNGVAYYLGTDLGITHTWTDTTVTNGQQYYYAVCAYDYGFDPGLDSLAIYPSENTITVSRTPRGGTILPSNVVVVRPNPRVPGYLAAMAQPPAHVAGRGSGTVDIRVTNSTLIPDDHLFALTFTTTTPESIHAETYTLRDSTAHRTVIAGGRQFDGLGIGPVGDGLMPVIKTSEVPEVDTLRSGFRAGKQTNARFAAEYNFVLPQNLRRDGYPDDITVYFDSLVVDTGLAFGTVRTRTPAKFRIFAHTASGDSMKLRFRFRDLNGSATLDTLNEFVDIMSEIPGVRVDSLITWRLTIDRRGPTGLPAIRRPATQRDVYDLFVLRPFDVSDVFVFNTSGEHVDPAKAQADAAAAKPYVVPNPYVGVASFEPARFAISGRGERRMEFRNVPSGGTVRIYTVRGDLVQTLRQDGSLEGFVAWNLRTRDNLDVAPGLYVYHVEAPGREPFVGKLAIVK